VSSQPEPCGGASARPFIPDHPPIPVRHVYLDATWYGRGVGYVELRVFCDRGDDDPVSYSTGSLDLRGVSSETLIDLARGWITCTCESFPDLVNPTDDFSAELEQLELVPLADAD
jgi:hypothetical protein